MSDIIVEMATPAPEVEKEEVETVNVMAQEAFFMQDCVKVRLNNGTEKLISYEALVTILKSLTESMEESRTEGFSLPSNTFFFARQGNSLMLSSYYAERVCNLKYYDSKFDILTPNIIISHKLERNQKNGAWKMIQSRYFATDLTVGNLEKEFIFSVNAAKRIFLLPMTNTYSEGRMCYGGNQMPMQFTDNNLRSLDWYYQYMWASPFNDDLGVRSINDSLSPRRWYEKLKDCAENKKPFPYNLLSGYTAR